MKPNRDKRKKKTRLSPVDWLLEVAETVIEVIVEVLTDGL